LTRASTFRNLRAESILAQNSTFSRRWSRQFPPQMEAVGPEAVGQQPHVETGDGLVQDPLEHRIVVIALEDSQSRTSPVDGMVHEVAFGGASWSWHTLAIRLDKTDGIKGF
jgi:hypothetical protein